MTDERNGNIMGHVVLGDREIVGALETIPIIVVSKTMKNGRGKKLMFAEFEFNF